MRGLRGFSLLTAGWAQIFSGAGELLARRAVRAAPAALGGCGGATVQWPCRRRGLERDQLALQGAPPTMVQAVDRGFAASQAVGDLTWAQSDQVAQDDDLALFMGQRGQGLADGVHLVDVRLVARADIRQRLDRRGSFPPQGMDPRVPREPQKPREERDATIVVLADRRHQLCENVLRDVLGL